MRRHYCRLLTFAMALVILLSLVVAVAGCSSGSAGAIAMMKRLPRDTDQFVYVDVAAIRGDKDLEDLFEGFEDSFLEETGTGFGPKDLGISLDDLDRVAGGDDGGILEGRFDLEDVRDGLEDNDCDDDEYKGIETWEGDLDAFALMSRSTILAADSIDWIEDCIDVIRGDDDSLYDDADMRDLVRRLPGGFMIYVYAASQYTAYEDLEAIGASVSKRSADTLRLTMVYLFDDGDSAEDARSDIRDEAEDDDDYRNVEVTQYGRYVTVVADVDIEDLEF